MREFRGGQVPRRVAYARLVLCDASHLAVTNIVQELRHRAVGVRFLGPQATLETNDVAILQLARSQRGLAVDGLAHHAGLKLDLLKHQELLIQGELGHLVHVVHQVGHLGVRVGKDLAHVAERARGRVIQLQRRTTRSARCGSKGHRDRRGHWDETIGEAPSGESPSAASATGTCSHGERKNKCMQLARVRDVSLQLQN